MLVDPEEVILWLYDHNLGRLCRGEVGDYFRLGRHSRFCELLEFALAEAPELCLVIDDRDHVEDAVVFAVACNAHHLPNYLAIDALLFELVITVHVLLDEQVPETAILEQDAEREVALVRVVAEYAQYILLRCICKALVRRHLIHVSIVSICEFEVLDPHFLRHVELG